MCWRETTIDLDLTFDPEPAGVFEAIPALKRELQVHVELAASSDFRPGGEILRDGVTDCTFLPGAPNHFLANEWDTLRPSSAAGARRLCPGRHCVGRTISFRNRPRT